MDIVKSVNIFLSIFGYMLDCDPKELKNAKNNSVVDQNGLIVGSLEKTEESGFSDETYKLNISSMKFGDINGQVFVIKEKDFTRYTFPFEIKGKKYDDSPFYRSIGETMEIIIPNADSAKNIEISNIMRLYDNEHRIIFEFYSGGSDKTISFSTTKNILRIYSNTEGDFRYKASNSQSDEEIQIYQNGRILEYVYNCGEKSKEQKKVSGSVEISDEDTPIEAMCKAVTSVKKLGVMHSVIDISSFIKEFRRLCRYDENTLFILNNIASITLGEYSNSFSKNDMIAIFGFVPWELPSTPIVTGDGTLISPRNKRKQKIRTNYVVGTL